MYQPTYTKRTIFLILLILLIGFVAINQGITEEHNTTLSGRITTPKGEPISDVTVLILYMKFNDDPALFTRLQTLLPIYDSKFYPFLPDTPSFYNEGKSPDITNKNALPPFLESKTDADGKFTFSNISSKLVQLMVLPNEPLDKDSTRYKSGKSKHTSLPIIHSLKLNEITFLPHQNKHFPPIGAVTFTIEPGRKIENIELKVSMQNPFSIRGRIVFKNGTPVSDTSLTIKFGHHNFYYANQFPYRIPISVKTDEKGLFTHSVFSAGIYAYATNYRGLSATSKPFFLDGNTPHDVIELTLNGNPDELAELPMDSAKSIIPGPDLSGVWILNPENGHVYKRIRCKSREDAQIKASQEDAHLVTITSDKEQIWLESVFGTSPYWIGLTGYRNKDDWLWDTGEHLKYKNWIKGNLHRPPPAIFKLFGWGDDKPKPKNKDYAIMTQDEKTGYMKWETVKQRHSDRGYTRLAVIEKDKIDIE